MSSLLCKPWLLNFMQDNLKAIFEKKLESQPSPAKQRNLVQIIDHSENLEVHRVQQNDVFVLHISDGFHYVTAKISPKFVKRFYRLHPDYCPLSKLRGAVIRLDSYSFILGGPNQTPCSLLLHRFDYIGSASSATFRSPKNTFKILTSFISSLTDHHPHHAQLLPSSPITTDRNVLNSIRPESTKNQIQHQQSLRLAGAKNSILNQQKTSTNEKDTRQILGTDKNNNDETNVNGTDSNNNNIIVPQSNNNNNNNLSAVWSIDQFINMMMNSSNNHEGSSSPSRMEAKLPTSTDNSNSKQQQKETTENKNDDICESFSSEQTMACTSNVGGDFFQNEEENCLISASQLEQINNMQIQGFNNSESLLIPPNPSQTTLTSSQISSFPSSQPKNDLGEVMNEPVDKTPPKFSPATTSQRMSSSNKKASTPSSPVNSPNIREVPSISNPEINEASKNIHPSSPQMESPNIKTSADTPKPSSNNILSPALGVSNSTLRQSSNVDISEGTIVFTSQSQSLTPLRINQHLVNTQPLPPTPSESEIKTSTSSAEASIIQSQEMSDGDSSDVLDDENPAEIAFSQKATSVFSPSISRYRNMASPNVFLHTQAASQRSDDLPLTQPSQTTKAINKRRSRVQKRVKSYLDEVTNESSDEALDEDEGFPRSLFMKDPLLLENFAIQNVKQRTEIFQSMRDILEKKNKEMKTLNEAKKVASQRPITNDEMIDYLQTEPSEERRKSHGAHNNFSRTEINISKHQSDVSKQAEATSENIIEEMPSKKMKTSPVSSSQKENLAPVPSLLPLPQFAKPVDTIVTTSKSVVATSTSIPSASPSLPVQSATIREGKQQQQNNNTSSKPSTTKKVNYKAWLDFI
ncbi:hypothetical protein FDP41_011537 [Naegleria fowleri]|uniref:Uncharacterized protein n=1 Tax=Naegleria fowleri TaxID=5763 RepID=A0A6A5BZ99_NAEFO|nr:uncharacterized protein FDP41_011537 [Naegleria fowleri]KAF0982607.1 hypothetical protein FDP41_011537 [Naegleria fowleri]